MCRALTQRLVPLLHAPTTPASSGSSGAGPAAAAAAAAAGETKVIVPWPNGSVTRVELSDRRAWRCWRRLTALLLRKPGPVPITLAVNDLDAYGMSIEAVVGQVRVRVSVCVVCVLSYLVFVYAFALLILLSSFLLPTCPTRHPPPVIHVATRQCRHRRI